MTSNSYFSRATATVLVVFALLIAGYAVAPSSAFAADGMIDLSLQGNYEAPEFLALTSIPGVQEAANSRSLAILLNNLYRLCIGAAAVIAVLKIVQGGVTYMLGDSVTEKKEAKHHITMAVLGLVFILSPYLVFNVIDPRILKLDVDVSGLTPGPVTPPTLGGTAPSTRNGDRLSNPEQIAACTATPNCQAITVQGANPYMECSCATRTDNTDRGAGQIFPPGAASLRFAADKFVYIATTVVDLQTTDNRACRAIWGGSFPTAAACTEKKTAEEQAHRSEPGFRVISDCGHVTTEVQVDGACVPPYVEPARGDFPGFN